MKKITLTIFLSFICIVSFAQEEDYQTYVDSLEKTFTYEHGTIDLKNGIGRINVPAGFKYLNGEQSNHVLVDLWGNPDDGGQSMGFILPENQGVMSDSGYVFNIEYNEIGFVKDEDADEIDYDELLTQMRKDAVEENKERVRLGYDKVEIVGWAATPFYDKERKILHWAKEIKFGDLNENTLNYNVRILGRKGVLVLNAISSMPNLPIVQKDIPNVLTIVQFNKGYQYEDFDPSIDQVAAWTIGGLVAGKILTKVGFFAVLLKFWKIIALAVIGFFGSFWKKMRGKKNVATDSGETYSLNENNDAPKV